MSEAMQAVVTAISTVGFPIVMCLLMFRQINELRGVIENNTLVLQELVHKIEGADKNGGIDE